MWIGKAGEGEIPIPLQDPPWTCRPFVTVLPEQKLIKFASSLVVEVSTWSFEVLGGRTYVAEAVWPATGGSCPSSALPLCIALLFRHLLLACLRSTLEGRRCDRVGWCKSLSMSLIVSASVTAQSPATTAILENNIFVNGVFLKSPERI